MPRPGRVDVDAPLADGRTALLVALRQRQVEAALFLIRVGHANAECRDEAGRTPLMYGVIFNVPEVVRCLVLERRVNVKALDTFGNSVATIAACEGNVWGLAFLVQEAKVVDIEATDLNSTGTRLLAMAAMSGRLESVRWMGKTNKDHSPTHPPKSSPTPICLTHLPTHLLLTPPLPPPQSSTGAPTSWPGRRWPAKWPTTGPPCVGTCPCCTF